MMYLVTLKVPVLVGNCDGFVGNRVMKPSAVEVEILNCLISSISLS